MGHVVDCSPSVFQKLCFRCLFSLSILAYSSGCRTNNPTVDIEHMLKQQADAWNRGDIDAFLDHYERSDALTFSSGGRTLRGWDATRDRYKKRYPDRRAMGKLQFGEIEVTPIEKNAALVLGTWQLERMEDAPGGNFSLVVRLSNGRWRIIHDHTSIRTPSPPVDPDSDDG